MSGANKGRKSKMSRPGSKKNLGLNQNPAAPYDGAYGNQSLVHVLLSLMGKKCRAKVRNGGVYEGIFHTFNPKMDVSMNVVHKCDTQGDHTASTNGVDSKLTNGCPKEEELIEQMVFLSENFVSACFEDVDLSFAALDANETNGESLNQTRSTSKSGVEKKLELWNGGGDALGGDSRSLGSLEDQSANGWDAGEMFSCNEEKFGVKSDYDASLSNYTMPLDIKETEKERIANASRIAHEIESGSDYKLRAELENDERISEEDKYSRVIRERDIRRDGRGPRDRERELEHGGYHEKERGDRDIQMSPHNYRSKHDYDRIPVNPRARGRGRDSREWEKRNQQSYNSGPNMGPSRAIGTGGPSGNRNQFPMTSHMDGSGGQGKSYRSNTTQSHLPPRMLRQNENNLMHNPYSQPPKSQRQTRMQQRSSNGRGPWGPDFGHPSPTQSLQESPGQPGGASLSRTSSSSSNTSAHTPNHRKHPSTSSQEEQIQHPHQNMIQTSSSSPTGSASIGNNNPQQSMTRSQTMPLSSSVPQSDTSYASIASRNPGGTKPQLSPGMPDTTQMRMAQGSPTGPPNQSPHFTKPRVVEGVVTVHSKATYTYTPKGSTPPINHNPQMPGNMGSPRIHSGTQPIHSMGDQPRAGQMMGRVSQQNVMPTSPQQQATNISGQIGPRQQHSQANNKVQSSSSEQQKQQLEKAEGSDELTRLKEFGKTFKLSANVRNKESPISMSVAATQPTANKVQQRQSSSMPQPPAVMSRQLPHPSDAMPQQVYQSSLQQQQQSFPITMSHSENISALQHAQATQNVMIPPKMVQHPGTFSQMQHGQQMNPPKMTQQIPMAPPNIQQFSVPSQQQTTNVSPQAAAQNPVVVQQTNLPPGNPKLMTSPKVESNYRPIGANVHVPTGPPLSQANPPAVITVSAAASSPIVSSHYPTATTQPSHNVSNQHEQSPPIVQAATPSNEASVSSPTSALNTSITSPTSTNVKALNPEAQEFKPRTPAKTARAPTPQTQPVMYVPAAAAYHPVSAATPVYNTGQMDHMQAPVQQVYPQFHQQQFLLQPQQVVQQIHGPPQFATFESSTGQVYTAPAPQASMMPQNNRMAAMPATPQYQPDQSSNVYVPIQTQGSNYLQQRPQSANTPTATHVTAASPANPSTHQVQQPTGHPTAMVPPHGVQGGSVPGQLWMLSNPPSNFMVVQGGQPQHPSGMHQPPPTQYMPAPMPQSGMSNVPAQQKSQPQAMQTAHYMPQAAQRYNQYQSPSTNN